MGERERDLLERCRVLESRLGTLGAYAHIVKTIGPFVCLNDQHQFVVIEDAASELARLRKIEAAARAVCEVIPAWAEELLEIHSLAPLRQLVETDDD